MVLGLPYDDRHYPMVGAKCNPKAVNARRVGHAAYIGVLAIAAEQRTTVAHGDNRGNRTRRNS
jgi:hypothetical protein